MARTREIGRPSKSERWLLYAAVCRIEWICINLLLSRIAGFFSEQYASIRFSVRHFAFLSAVVDYHKRGREAAFTDLLITCELAE